MISPRGINHLEAPFRRPTSVFLYGNPPSLLDWLAWAFASRAHGGYRWTDVRTQGDTLDLDSPIAKGAVPADLLRVRDPQELAPDNVAANAAITAGGRVDEHNPQLAQLADFLRLPPSTQRSIASARSATMPLVLVLSNGHRLRSVYNAELARATNRTLTAHGVTILDIFPHALEHSGTSEDVTTIFDVVWHLTSSSLGEWRKAILRVEKADVSDSISPGTEFRLVEIPLVASALTESLDPFL